MGILLAFAPFLAVAIVNRFMGPSDGLIIGALVSIAMIARDTATPGRSPKVLEIGTAVFVRQPCDLCLDR